MSASARRSRRSTASDTFANQQIKGLVDDRRAFRTLLATIEGLSGYPLSEQPDGSAWIERDWIVRQIRELLP